jgi:hypothetical protein
VANLFGNWGRSIPEDKRGKIKSTWGARAIYTGRRVDLLPDRQSWWAQGFPEDQVETEQARHEYLDSIKPLLDWVTNRGLPWLREEAKKRLSEDSNDVVKLDEGGFHIEGSPQGSYGYLYIRAWQEKTDG